MAPNSMRARALGFPFRDALFHEIGGETEARRPFRILPGGGE